MYRSVGIFCLGVALVLGAFVPDGYAHGISEAQRQSIVEGGNLRYLWLGSIHMMTGYDHLLFLLGVVFFLRRLVEIVKFVTAFTLGHSITLLFATLAGITANYFLIDAVIATSVIYIGFGNLDGFRKYVDIEPPNLLLMVFAFGLIHGFGLSARLQQFPLPEEGLVWRILSFNLGVELGQIAALVVMLTVIAGWRHLRSWAVFSRVGNVALMAGGALLFLFQVHGYFHASDPDGFGFSEDLHAHAHADLAAQAARLDSFEAIAAAEFYLDDLVAEAAVATAWAGVEAADARLASYRDGEAWLVEFHKPKDADVTNQRLYLYLSVDGLYLAVEPVER